MTTITNWNACDVLKEPASLIAEAVRLRHARGWAPMVLCVDAKERQAVEGALDAFCPTDVVRDLLHPFDIRMRGQRTGEEWVVWLRVRCEG